MPRQKRKDLNEGGKQAVTARKATPVRQEQKDARKKIKKLKKKQPAKERQAPRSPPDILDIPYPVPLGMNQEERDVLTVRTDFVAPALQEAFLAFAGYLGGTGLFSDYQTSGLPNPGPNIIDGLTYLFQATQELIKGNTQEITMIPRVFKDLICALKPKTYPFRRYANISYGWNPFATAANINNLNVGDGVINLAYPSNVDTGAYSNPLVVYSPSGNGDAYAALLKVVGTLTRTGYLDVISMDTPNIMDRDVSAFARSYRYCGLASAPTDGWCKSLENEGAISSPMYSSYCNYVVPDKRLPKNFCLWAGGASWTTGFPLSNAFHSHFNKIPTVVKQIDFEEIYGVLTLWMALLKEKAIAFGSTDVDASPFTFSQQDFRIVLRQALLARFKDTQHYAQFCSTIAYDGNTNSFVPFLVSPGTAARNVFGQLLIPTLIAENLACLTGRKTKIPGKTSKLNVASSIPVIGRWWADEPIIPVIVNGPSDAPLFADLSADQVNIRLTDMFATPVGGPVWIDPNSEYYQGVLSEWNYNVTKLSQFSCRTRPLVTDAGPKGCPLLYITKVQMGELGGAAKANGVKPNRTRFNPSMRNIKNNDYKKIERLDSKKKLIVEVVPPADLYMLNTTHVLSVIPTTTEQSQFYQLMITPTMRENASEDALTVQMYQTQTSEVCSDQISSNTVAFGTGVFANTLRYAGMCVTGIGKEESNEYTAMVSELEAQGKGGILGSIIGGLGAAIGIPQEISNPHAS